MIIFGLSLKFPAMNNIDKALYHAAVLQLQVAALKSVLSPEQRAQYDSKLEVAKLAFKTKHPEVDDELWTFIEGHLK